jgi:hypothetical protein
MKIESETKNHKFMEQSKWPGKEARAYIRRKPSRHHIHQVTYNS